MSLRNRLSRLERMSGDAGVEEIQAFFHLMQEHANDPEVSAAVDGLWDRMKEAEAALSHPIMPREWLDDRRMQSRGLMEANNRLMQAMHACAVRGVEGTRGGKTAAREVGSDSENAATA